MSSNYRGRAVIINNVNFVNVNDERLGAEKDGADLEKLFRAIHFDVVPHLNKTAQVFSLSS